MVVGFTLLLAVVPETRPGSFVAAGVGVMLMWPRRKKWVCEYCGVAYDQASLRGPLQDPTRVDGASTVR